MGVWAKVEFSSGDERIAVDCWVVCLLHGGRSGCALLSHKTPRNYLMAPIQTERLGSDVTLKTHPPEHTVMPRSYAAKSCGICGNEDLEEPIHDQYLAYCNECGRDVNQLYVP